MGIEAAEVFLYILASRYSHKPERIFGAYGMVHYFVHEMLFSCIKKIEDYYMKPDLQNEHREEMVMSMSSLKRRAKLLVKLCGGREPNHNFSIDEVLQRIDQNSSV